jgi:hypothetical protein
MTDNKSPLIHSKNDKPSKAKADLGTKEENSIEEVEKDEEDYDDENDDSEDEDEKEEEMDVYADVNNS